MSLTGGRANQLCSTWQDAFDQQGLTRNDDNKITDGGTINRIDGSLQESRRWMCGVGLFTIMDLVANAMLGNHTRDETGVAKIIRPRLVVPAYAAEIGVTGLGGWHSDVVIALRYLKMSLFFA